MYRSSTLQGLVTLSAWQSVRMFDFRKSQLISLQYGILGFQAKSYNIIEMSMFAI
jgi:hypothetical protein